MIVNNFLNIRQPKFIIHHSSFIILPSTSRRFWITMALCAIIYLPSLFWALGLDQNIFAEIGWLLLHGQKLYVNAWDVKPPNVFYIYGFFEWIFGPHVFAVRISDYICSLLACAAVYMATARQAPHISRTDHKWIPPLAALLLIITLLSLGLADTAQTESYSLFFLVGASVLVQAPRIRGLKRESSNLLFIAGIFLGIATFLKTSNAVFVVAIIIEVWLYTRRLRMRSIAIMLSGFIVCCAAQLGVLAMQGSLAEYLHIARGVLLEHPKEVSQLTFSQVPLTVWAYVDLWILITLIAIGIAIWRRHISFLRAALSPSILLIAGIVTVLIQNKGWGYQYVVILPGLGRLCAISAAYVYHFFRWRKPKAAKPLAVIVILATIFITPSARRRIHYSEDALRSIQHHSAYLASLGAKQSLYYPPCTDSLAGYLSSHTEPTDEVFIFGEEPGAYWRADRMPASRFVYSLLFTSGVIPTHDFRAMQDSLVQKRPEIITVERFDTTAFRGRPETSESLLAADTIFRPLKELLSNAYQSKDTVCGKFLIYTRR
jgi:hypothetical protein